MRVRVPTSRCLREPGVGSEYECTYACLCKRSPPQASRLHASAALAWAEGLESTCFAHQRPRGEVLAPPTRPARHREPYNAHITRDRNIFRAPARRVRGAGVYLLCLLGIARSLHFVCSFGSRINHLDLRPFAAAHQPHSRRIHDTE